MSVTVFIQRRKGVSRWQPGKRWFLLPILLIAAGAGVYQHATDQFKSQQHTVDTEKLAREAQHQRVLELKGATESQLATLAQHVALMQAKLTRLEALGQQLAAENQLSEQFDFNAQVGVGGLTDIGEQLTLAELMAEIDSMAQRLEINNQQLPLLETVSSNLNIGVERYISGRPIEKGWLSSPYGIRNDPFNGRKTHHKGIDFAGSEGSNVVATAAGVVTWSGSMFGYGNLVEIDHGNGISTRYGHNKDLSVTVGDVVTKGEKIAIMGSTGRSTGPHVHYEVLRNGQQIDPTKYVLRKPV
ncbi:M23 family metallopeptidase [Shewanella sp. NIFS-20-20]|uniref:M23 family metallopeptidase n=1 Tax=Shewanella sp. NIFS-20-20 TaxID=2853806 RepID=UPI001C49528C|nr:M23 family metallopeptidase [Shewanella sp. NIFS-20-20]MBV7315764.1 peptidoglycan DD-metalloendopeptidase family protein [Shewanella sp. NIFS-20-20]